MLAFGVIGTALPLAGRLGHARLCAAAPPWASVFPSVGGGHLCPTLGPSSGGWRCALCPGPLLALLVVAPSPGRAHLAGIGLAVEVASTQHVGADVGPVHLRAAALVVSHQGYQRLPQGAGVATHVCGHHTRRQGGQGSCATHPLATTLAGCPPTHTHSRPGGPSPQSGTCVRMGRGCLAQAGRWAGRTGSGGHSGLPSSSAGSGLAAERPEVSLGRGGP